MSIAPGVGEARELEGGGTALQKAGQFVTVRTAGVRDLIKNLESLAGAAQSQTIIKKACEKASKPLMDDYKSLAERHEATGNLAKSVTMIYRAYKEGGVAVVGPRQTGASGSRPGVESGNHAWLVEFGTGPRKPGSKGRRTYVNVHQAINGKMRRAGSFNNRQFEQMGRGYYFIMGSAYDRGVTGSKYSRDFAGPGQGGDGRKQHPIILKPGDTIAPMPALGLMEDTITANTSEVFGILKAYLEAEITIRGG
jgi:hypothetical protein